MSLGLLDPSPGVDSRFGRAHEALASEDAARMEWLNARCGVNLAPEIVKAKREAHALELSLRRNERRRETRRRQRAEAALLRMARVRRMAQRPG